jgi:CheY-like chemotaxis protein
VSTPLAGKRLLLIVEDSVLAELLAEAAARLGADAVVASTGQAALDAAAGPPGFGAAVLDLPLPDVRGAEVLQALKRAGSGGGHLGAFRGRAPPGYCGRAPPALQPSRCWR